MNENAMRVYLNFKRFCLVDEGAEEADSNRGARPRKRMLMSRIKQLMSNTPKKARGMHSHAYSEPELFGHIVIACNQVNMPEAPACKDDLERWLLFNSSNFASFQSVDDDDESRHIYRKDPDFFMRQNVQAKRLGFSLNGIVEARLAVVLGAK